MNSATDFWSNRKAKVRAEAEAELEAVLAAEQEAERRTLAEKSDEEILNELELPDPDTLERGDDFSAFMAKTVPERIKRRALRKLWLSNPTLANLDGLVDYGEDYTDSATVVENLQTAYQVGKGMLKHVLEMEKQNDDDQDEDELDSEATVSSAIEEAELTIDQSTADDPEPISLAEAEERIDHYEPPEPEMPCQIRRMRFSFAGENGAGEGIVTQG